MPDPRTTIKEKFHPKSLKLMDQVRKYREYRIASLLREYWVFTYSIIPPLYSGMSPVPWLALHAKTEEEIPELLSTSSSISTGMRH